VGKKKSKFLKRLLKSRVVTFLRRDDGFYLQQLAGKSEENLGQLTQQRQYLRSAFLLALIATALVWLLALSFPHPVARIFSTVINSNLPRYGTLLTILTMAIPFSPPFLAAFVLGNMLWPESEVRQLPSEVMSGFNYSQNANRRWFILVGAGVCGAVNCGLLFVALLILTGN